MTIRSFSAISLLLAACAGNNNRTGNPQNPEGGTGGSAGQAGATAGTGQSGGQGGSNAMGGGGTGALSGAGGSAGSAAGSAGTAGSNVSPSGVRVVVLPSSTTLIVGMSTQFSATVTGNDDTSVTWSLVDAANCGTLSDSGEYTAPSAVPSSGFCRVRATSNADDQAFATATINVVEGGSVGEPGVWYKPPLPVNITDPNSGGAQTCVVDPVRPSDFYVFLTLTDSEKMVVLKSTDYGASWTDVNTTAALRGNPWGAAIDPNPNRDPNTPPTLYTPAGFGALGLWKSTDGGVTWSNTLEGSTPFDPYNPYGAVDVYGVTVLPDDPPNHVLFTYHYSFKDMEDSGFGESTDGGRTWTVHMPPAGIGASHYMMAVNESIWLSISQYGDGSNGIWKTETAGRVNGVVSTEAWRKVDTHEHLHGSFGPYINPANGNIYAPGYGGIKRSTDRGDSWEFVHEAQWVSNVVASDRFMYGSYIWGPDLIRAEKSNDTQWESYTDTPADMAQAAPPFGAAASFDGAHWVIVMSADDNGVWRYIEP